jgi:hypothetical protein
LKSRDRDRIKSKDWIIMCLSGVTLDNNVSEWSDTG